MLILAVHSTTPTLGVACAQDNRVLGAVVLPPGRQHLENLAAAIQDLMVRLHKGLADMDGFGVAVGPGSFSGIRIGLATFKGMALALGKPVAGISCLDILAWQGLRSGETGASVIDAKRGDLYGAVYKRTENHLELLAEPKLIRRDEFGYLMSRTPSSIVISAGQEHPGDYGNSVHLRRALPSAGACAELAFERISRGDSDELHALAPLYIRRSDAEEKRDIQAYNR